MRPLNVAVMCEASGTVRDLMREAGHNAWSIDILGPDETPEGFTMQEWDAIWRAQRWPNYHLTGDCLWWEAAGPDGPWDLAIVHPPCTYLANSGVQWLKRGRNVERMQLLAAGAHFFERCYKQVKARLGVVLENPVMHGYASRGLALRGVPRFSYSVQPWQFGTPEVKRTCFWVQGELPRLVPTVDKKPAKLEARVHREPPAANRWYYRSLTDPNIAAAMVRDWAGGRVRLNGSHA